MSKPVTSMKKSLVSSLTVVWLPLIIGGKDMTSSLESRITGYDSKLFISLEYSNPFG